MGICSCIHFVVATGKVLSRRWVNDHLHDISSGGKNAYREELIQKMKAQLDQWDIEIDRFSAQAQAAQDEAKLKYQAQIEALKQQREEAKLQLHALQASSEDAWDSLREGMESAWDAISKATKDALFRFK